MILSSRQKDELLVSILLHIYIHYCKVFSLYINIFTLIHIYTHTHTRMYVCMYVCMYVYIYIHNKYMILLIVTMPAMLNIHYRNKAVADYLSTNGYGNTLKEFLSEADIVCTIDYVYTCALFIIYIYFYLYMYIYVYI